MAGDADIAAIGAALADRGRSRMLLALGDGRALAASTLAAEAGVAPSTASKHLSVLLAARLVEVEPRGRNRFYRLSGPHVGELIEALARVAPASTVRSLRDGTRADALRRARSCYDHLAGRLGTDLLEALLERDVLEREHGGYRITGRGRAELGAFGVEVEPRGRRPLLRPCLDWTERRDHLAGALGAGLLARLLELRWLERLPQSRALRVTDAGRNGLAETFGLCAA